MVENISFSDALTSVTQPAAPAEHEKAMQALQSELEYHRKYVGNGTYLDSAVSYVYDGGTSDSMHKLELAYKNEQENPNSVSREDVIKLVEQDQKRLHRLAGNTDNAVGLSAAALALAGGKGRLAATALIAFNSVHPNDSIAEQAMEGFGGAGLGMLCSHLFEKGWAMPNKFLGGALSAAAYPIAGNVARIQWPNQKTGQGPDAEQIFKAEVPKTIYSPYSSLQPGTNPEWGKFDFLKK